MIICQWVATFAMLCLLPTLSVGPCPVRCSGCPGNTISVSVSGSSPTSTVTVSNCAPGPGGGTCTTTSQPVLSGRNAPVSGQCTGGCKPTVAPAAGTWSDVDDCGDLTVSCEACEGG